MNRLAAALMLCTLVPRPAFAACGTVEMPPAQFDHTPSTNPVIHFMDYWALDRFCSGIGAKRGGPGRLEGCENSRGEVWLPKEGTGGVTLQDQQCFFRHARGHLNGWAWDHPGARYE